MEQYMGNYEKTTELLTPYLRKGKMIPSSTFDMGIVKSLLSTLHPEAMIQSYYRELNTLFETTYLVLVEGDKKLTSTGVGISDYVVTLGITGQTQLQYHFKKPLTQAQQQSFQHLHVLAAMAFENALSHTELKRLARKDQLTKLDNRSAFDEHLNRMLSQAKRDKSTNFGLLVLDLDNFKQVNDNMGHLMGDEVLEQFAATLQSALRQTDFCFRYAGDEFCCLLPGSIPTVNEEISVRIQRAMSKNNWLSSRNISVSIGSAYYREGDTAKTLFKRADEALYDSKLINGNSACYA